MNSLLGTGVFNADGETFYHFHILMMLMNIYRRRNVEVRCLRVVIEDLGRYIEYIDSIDP